MALHHVDAILVANQRRRSIRVGGVVIRRSGCVTPHRCVVVGVFTVHPVDDATGLDETLLVDVNLRAARSERTGQCHTAGST